MAAQGYEFLTDPQITYLNKKMGSTGFNTIQKRVLLHLADGLVFGPVKSYIDSVVVTGVPGPAGPAGPAGSAGATGPQGPVGAQGVAGPTGPQGPQGIQGIQGGTGATGATGAMGPPGSTWRNGTGVPSNGLGANGDYYLENITGDVYLKAAGVYTVQLNLKGPTGPQGPAGVGGGSGGVYQIGGGGTPTELAPAAASWTYSGTTPPTLVSGKFAFASASNLAAAIATGIATTDTGTYNVTYTIDGYAGGGVRLIIYGDNTPNLGSGLTRNANGTFTEQITVIAGAGSQSNQLRFQATGTSGTNTFNVSNVSVTPTTGGGGGGVARDMTVKVSEIEVSVLDFGADPTGVVASDAAFAAAIAYSRRIHIPAGIYRLNTTLNINRSVFLYGDGREVTEVRSYVSGANHGMICIGETALGRSNLMQLSHFKFRGMGTQTTAGASASLGNWSGVYIQRKVLFQDMYIQGFTNDGIYYSPLDENETGTLGTIDQAVFFSRMDNTWSKDNGRDGISVRRGANANSFVNCQFDRNGRYGFRHWRDGFSIYGNTIRDGQCAYNASYGYYFQDGTNIVTSGLYAELNSGYTGAGQVGVDFYIGDNCVRSWIGIGVLYNQELTKVRLPGFNPATIQVWEGGRRLFGDT